MNVLSPFVLYVLCFIQEISPFFVLVVNVKKEACFRRVLAGKRIARRFVRRSLFCERIEDCQMECGDEKRFICEGFNYRLGPTNRGKGECELLDVPLQALDIGRDVYPDRDYDYYERDRNAATVNCQNVPPYPGHRPEIPYGRPPYDRRPGYDVGPPIYDRWPPSYDRRPIYDRKPPIYDRLPPAYDRRPPIDYDRRPPIDYDRRRPYHIPDDHRRGDTYHNPHHQNDYKPHTFIDRSDTIHQGTHYLPPNPSKPMYHHKQYNFKPYGYGTIDEKKYYRPKFDGYKPYGSDIYHKYNINRYDYEHKDYYLPPKVGGTKDWGKYGGSYGNFGHKYEFGSNHYGEYWGLDDNRKYDPKPPLPLLPPPPPRGSHPPQTALEINVIHQGPNIYSIGENLILPAEPRLPGYNYLKEECSLRTATGFKLSKGIVKKFYAVPNIYECELLCFKEREFPCASYAFRYTISLSAPADNCYLSNRNYKELDYYTDVQPDRDFDIYTMNNMNRCAAPPINPRDDSDCFWRVRSGHKLSHKVVKSTLFVKSIVECQVECLQIRKFTCRAFSFRYGSSVLGGIVDNCQLTDWPFFELDPNIDFLPQPGFEVYERGSFGHGCEPYHFGVRGRPSKDPAIEIDQLCYIGFGSPARLLPQATKKAVKVKSELDCKTECSKLREGSLFQCMSFSYRSHPHGGANCFLSDIHQRDLLPFIDYVQDADSWLFAWDNYNPKCIELKFKPIHDKFHEGGQGHLEGRHPHFGPHYALDTWRAYSVSGWPCRRGHLCQENREAGFWFCKLEGGDASSWDYCCRPDHQCGYSTGSPFPWCYVGPEKTQWRKCSDRYYPYIHNLIDRLDHKRPSYPAEPPAHPWLPIESGPGGHYLPEYDHKPSFIPAPPIRPGFRPNRPPAPPHERPPEPSLDEYEMQFDQQFLAPPKPGGFGQPRHWPVSYLHKDMPPNITDSEPRLMKSGQNKDTHAKLNAIQSLIDIINSNDLKNVQYQITNESNSMDDILFVKIPLPTNFTKQDNAERANSNINTEDLKLEAINIFEPQKNTSKRFTKALELMPVAGSDNNNNKVNSFVPTYRRGYVTRTNVTRHGRSSSSRSL
ncbi:hypothetical protein HHI36_003284 [Cryptolaemus montrouzieri]|uniref:Apple domain-containing protein n=1 Tax=Cryptolaemus montrouzieri TaxID=559131 RepID=A0ABD2PDQ0_9CUCU